MNRQTLKRPRIVRCIDCYERFNERAYADHRLRDVDGKLVCVAAQTLVKAGWKQDALGVWMGRPA